MGKNENFIMFSVVIPVYNKEKYLVTAIESVLKQTYVNYEIILIDDCSEDGSSKIVDSYESEKIRVLKRNEPGPGGYAARNLGIKEARGEWIAFLDADDKWYPRHLEKMAALAKAIPNSFFLGCGWEIKTSAGIKVNSYYEKHKNLGNHKITIEEYFMRIMKRQRPAHTSMVCVKKDSPVVANLFPESSGSKRGGDLYAWLKMICCHKEMAWSSHLGGYYSSEVEGQVIKTARSTPFLMDTSSYCKLSNSLDGKQKILLKKAFNRSLKEAWVGNIKRQNENFNLREYIYYGEDIFYALFLLIISFFHPAFIHCFYVCGRYLKNIAAVFSGTISKRLL